MGVSHAYAQGGPTALDAMGWEGERVLGRFSTNGGEGERIITCPVNVTEQTRYYFISKSFLLKKKVNVFRKCKISPFLHAQYNT